jgi:putative transposase
MMFTAVRRAQAAGEEQIDAGLRELLAVDSTVVRAHQHAAGARRDSPDTGGRVE